MSELQPLPTWLDAGAAALAGAEPPAQTLAAALPGLARAQSLTPMQRLQRVRESGLAESSGAGEPVALAWRRFLRGHGPSVLVIDATGLDVRARGTAAVLDGAPRLLAEGVLIAAGLRDSRTVELRLPAELTGHEAAFLNAVDAIRSLAQVSTPRMQLEVKRDSRPTCWGEGQAGDGSRLVHTPETWCSYRPAVRRCARPRCVVAHAPARHEAARPGRARTVRQPAEPDRRLGRRRGGRSRRRARLRRRPGRLPAAVRGGPLVRSPVVRVRRHRPGAVQPDGDGRGRVRRQADRACALPSLAPRRRRGGRVGAPAAGARRAPDKRDHPRPRRARPSRRPRRGGARAHRPGAGGGLAARQLPAPLPRAVGAARAARVLPRGALPGAQRGALPPHVSGQHRHPELHGPPRSRRLSRHDRGHPARQPAAADLRPGLPGAVRIRLRARRQQRRRLHPAAEAQGGRALPRRRRLPETRAGARHGQADRHRRLRAVRSHRGLLPAHLRPPGRGLRVAGEGRRDAALRHPGLPHAARSARPGDRPDRSARHPDPHRRRGRQPRGLPQGLRRRVPRPRHPALAPPPDRRRPSGLRARRHRLPPCRSQRRSGPGRAAGRRHRRRRRLDRRRPDGPAAGRAARRPDCPRQAPRHDGQPARDRERRRRRRAAPPGLGPGQDRRGRRGHPPVLRADARRGRQVRSDSSTRPAC